MLPSRRAQYALHAALALAGVLPTLLIPGSTVGDGVDAFGTHWFYWWIRTCVEQFGNPSWTPLFYYPQGKDIFAHTGNNFVDALLSVPFQWVFGPTLYQPLFIVFLQIGNVASFRPLARYVLGDGFACFAATLLWQLNPFLHFEITAGRPTQAMAWFLPIAVLYFLRAAREPGWRNGVLLGIAVALSAWTYWFTAYFLAILLVPLAVWELRAGADRRGVLLRWGLGVVVCLAIVLPGIVGMYNAIHDGKVPGIDPSDPLVEGWASVFQAPKPLANNVSAELHGDWLMELYGSPLFFQPAWLLPLLLVPWFPRLTLPGGRARWLVALGVVLLFAQGTSVRAFGQSVVMPHYMFLYRYLPFFDRLWFPYRLAVVGFIPAALLVGALCASVARPRWALAALVVGGLGGQYVAGTWPFNHRYSRAPPMVASLRHEGGGVLFLPMMIQHDGLVWQTEFQLPTFGGMGESAAIFWPDGFKKRLKNTLVKALRTVALTPNNERKVEKKDRMSLEREGFRWVILRRSLVASELRRQLALTRDSFDTGTRIRETIAAISVVVEHPPAGVDGDAVVWDLRGQWVAPEPFTPTPDRLADHGWQGEGMTVYEEKLLSIGRTGRVRDQTPPTPSPLLKK